MVAPLSIRFDAGSGASGKPSGSYIETGLNGLQSMSRSEKAQARHAYVLKRNANRQVNLGDRGNVRFNRAGGLFWKTFPGQCQPASATWLGTRMDQAGIPGLLNSGEGKYICRAPISFYEQSYPARENDYRIFIDGVEVTAYVRGSLSWTIETTGGMNTCRFDLNNNHDAFILSPTNICSNLSTNGWRIDSPSFAPRATHNEPRYDELAKYLLYRNKYRRVSPGSPAAEIDPETGMWLYPLNPYECIINVHDPVRIFRKLPHIDGAATRKGNGKLAYYDLWIAAYTGFISEVHWDDDYVEGDRKVSLACYDYRGIMERQRVRISGIPLKTQNPGNKQKQKQDFIDKIFAYKSKTKEPADKIAQQAADHNLTPNLKELYEILRQNQLLSCKSSNDNAANSQAAQCYNSGLAIAKSQVAGYAGQARDLEAQFYNQGKEITRLSGETAKLIIGANEVKFEYQQAASTAANQIAAQQRQDLINSTARQGAGPTRQDSSNFLVSGDATGAFISNSNQPAGSVPAGTGGVQMLVNGKPVVQGVIAVDVQFLARDSGWANKQTGVQPNVKRPTITVRASGDIELLQGMDTYLLTSPTERAPLVPASGHNPYGETTPEQAQKNAEIVDTEVIHQAIAKLSTTTAAYIVGNAVRPAGISSQFNAVTAANKVAWRSAIQAAWGRAATELTTAKQRMQDIVSKIRALLAKIQAEIEAAKKKQNDLLKKNNMSPATAVDKLAELTRKFDEARRTGQQKLDPRVQGSGNLAEIIVNEPTFDKRHAGLFADLVRAVDKDEHPLAGMCYEEAAVWLCCSNSFVLPSTLLELDGYGGRGTTMLQEWNKTVIFGAIGRPLTYNEVTHAGRLSTADFSSPLSPFRPLLHMLLPKSGTGARTVVQQDITANTGNSTSFQHATRKSLLDEISNLLNYQYFTNGWGDLVFEFPHYNAAPPDFGRLFQGAYTLEKEIRGATFTPETADMYTAWVLEGNEPEKSTNQSGNIVINNLKYKASITAPILARRFGVKVETIKIDIPGVGAQIGGDKQPPGGIESLLAYGLLYIQRQIGEAYRVSIREFPDRPYLLPNRPFWIVPRQKICLSKVITYTMDKPNGDSTVSIDCGFTRWMFRDGTFRTILGGEGGVINYAGILTGSVKYELKEGVGNPTSSGVDRRNSRKQQRSLSQNSCDPRVKASYLRSGNYLNREIAGQTDQYVHHSSDVVGFGNDGGFTPPVSVFGFGKYGAQLFRQGANPGNKTAAFANVKKAGLRVQGQAEGKKDVYQINKLFLNPYPFGEGHGRGSLYDSWGNMRYNNKGYAIGKITYKGDIEMPWHSGVDISWAAGTDIHTPINLRSMSCYLDVGPGPSKAPNVTGYVEYGYVADVPGTYKPVIPTHADALAFATNTSSPKFKDVTRGGRKVRFILVYKKLYELWKKLTDKGGNIKIKRGRGTSGFYLTGIGEVTIPGGTSQNGFAGKVITCRLGFAHCQEIMGEQKGNKFRFYGAGIETCNKGTVIAKIGSVGTHVPHAHISMSLLPPKWKWSKSHTDEDAFKETLKANNEYITTQLLLRFTGGNPQSNQLSPFWQKAFKSSRLKITTVREAVEYALRNSGFINYYIEPKQGAMVETNPFFFFKPEEFIYQVGKVAQEKKWPAYYSSQGYFDQIGQFAKTDTPICGNITDDESKKIRIERTKCILAAQAQAPSNYRTAARATYKCQQNAVAEATKLAKKSRNQRSKDQQVAEKVKAKAKKSMKNQTRPGSSSGSAAG